MSRVYFIRPVGMDGPIKIGCSAKPMNRLLVLSAWSPFPLEIIGDVPGSFKDEKLLHRRFSDLHTRKEWFMSSPLLRQTIDQILGGMTIREACKELVQKAPIQRKQPPRTPDRELFLLYGRKIRRARESLGYAVRWHEPDDVTKIMRNWRSDKANGHVTIIPSAEQLARLDEFVADPRSHCWSEPWKKIPRDPICIPVVVGDEVAAC